MGPGCRSEAGCAAVPMPGGIWMPTALCGQPLLDASGQHAIVLEVLRIMREVTPGDALRSIVGQTPPK